MGAEEKVFASPSEECDDLKAIVGIGPKWADALYEIGVLHFRDLAQYTPQDLSKALLEQAGVRVLPERIEAYDWISQARELAQDANLERTPLDQEAEAEAPELALSRTRWKQHAGFSVFFDYGPDEHGERTWQTRVYDGESGVEELWPGTEPAVWVNWILERAKLPATMKPVVTRAEATAPPALVSLGDAQVEILGVKVTEGVSWPEVGEKRLGVEVRFKVSGTGAEQLATFRIPFQVQLSTSDVESGASTLVASQVGQLEPQVLVYTSRQEFPIPELGSYQLRTDIQLLQLGETMAYHQGPTFGVVACLSRYVT
jgi:hypothetical protein